MKPSSDNLLNISVIMPALNEENNIQAAITNTLRAFGDFDIRGEIIVINDGSTDRTEQTVSDLMKGDSRIRMLKHEAPKGVGNSFWDGVDNAAADYIVMLPGDNENDPWEIFRYFRLLDHVDMVIPFVFTKDRRPLHRRALSGIYRFIVNTTFQVNFNYTNGTVLFRKSILKDLDYRSNGFFFHTDILVRATKKGYLFAEVPYSIWMRRDGVSSAITYPSLTNVIRGYLKLVKDIYLSKKVRMEGPFTADSQTLARHENHPKTTGIKKAQ